MEFIPGSHALKQTIDIFETNLTCISLHGDSNSFPEITSRIVCTWPAGFVFEGINELYISALSFISCGHNDSAAVNIISVQQSNITNCSFHNSINTGARGYNDDDGAALFIENSNVILTGSSFQNNSASYNGGVLEAADSTLMVTDNMFQNISAGLKGVLQPNLPCYSQLH